MKSRADLTALVGSRICHDLISPLGAIGNGVELLELSGMQKTPEMALIAESVENANARIRFFRVAYGPANEEQRIARSEVTTTLAAAARGGRMSYFWEAEGDQSRREVRAVFLLLQCCETAMPQGGDIHVRRHGERWEITADAPRLLIDEPLWTALITPRARINVDAAKVQFALLPEVLADLGRSLAIKLTSDSITARF
jgi:histidine phosphotransferase ChpT